MRQPQAPLYFAFLPCLICSVNCQGAALLTLSNNPVCSGEKVTLACSYGRNVTLLSITIDAFDGPHKKGSLSCRSASGNTTISGIFNGNVSLHGCPGVTNSSLIVNLSMMALPSLELDFNCTTVVTDGQNVDRFTSATISLIVDDLQITPNPAIFNESDNATVKCESRRLSHTSLLQLSITSPNGSEITASGNGSTSAMLPLPLMNWHNAVVKCFVTNRNSADIPATAVVFINHITCINGPSGGLKEAINGTLNCSTYVSGYPIESYRWSVPPEISDNDSSLLNDTVFTLTHGNSSSFNCTVANSVTNQRAIVVFEVNSSHALNNEETNDWYIPHCFLTTPATVSTFPTQIVANRSSLSEEYWIVCSVLGGSFIIIGLAVGMACRRRKLRQDVNIKMTDNDLYVHLPVKSRDVTPAQPRKPGLHFHRILIADKGVIAELSTLVLPTTAVMEYSTGYEALNEILATLSRTIKLPTTPTFKSVALFLPTVDQEMPHGEENQTMQGRTSIMDDDAQTLKHIARLAEMCLDQQSGSRGIDIFNYYGPDAASLADMLTRALMVPVTVSYGYGFGESKDLKKVHASAAAKYFNFSRLTTATSSM